jgi:putative effector of murein hydrolase
VGTARAFSGIAMSLNALVTSLLVPLAITLLLR